MAMADLFYPGNPARREKVIAKMQRVYVLMEENFNATDELIQFLNKHVSPSPKIAGIEVDKSATFGKNAQTMIDKMKEIQGQVSKIEKDLSKKLEPDVYKSLTDNNTNFEDKLKFFKTLKTSVEMAETLLTSIGGYLVISQVVASARFIAVITGASEILLASFAGVVTGLIVAGAAIAIDAIISAIVGAVERGKLNHMIGELDGVLKKFEEPSQNYTKNIYEVLGVLKFILKET